MGEAEDRVALPAAVRGDLDAAQRAYERWVELADDYFNVDDQKEALADFENHLASVVEVSLGAGVSRERLRKAMSSTFPLAATAVASVIEDVDISDSLGPATRVSASTRAAVNSSRVCPQCGSKVGLTDEFCSKCGAAMPELCASDLLPLIAELQLRLGQQPDAPKLPSTNLLSPSFMTRAFAVYGHTLVAGFIVSIPFYIIYFLIFVVALSSR